VHIVQFGDMILALFTLPTVKLGLLEQVIREFHQSVVS
jgi:hypothetical protein